TLSSVPSGASDTNAASCPGTIICRLFSYTGSNNGSVIPALSPNMPSQGFFEVSHAGTTDNNILGVYELKSENRTGTLRALTAGIGILGNGNPVGTIPNLFNTVYLKSGDTIIATGNVGTVNGTAGDWQDAKVTFNDFSLSLPADQYVELSIVAKIAQDTNDRFVGILATSSLDLTDPNNIRVEDSAFNKLAVNSVVLDSNVQQLTEAIINLGGYPSTAYGGISRADNDVTVQSFTFILPITAGKNAVYISKNPYEAIATSTNPAGLTISPLDFSDDDSNGDGPTYFYLGPNQTKTLTAVYQAVGPRTAGGVLRLEALFYGTDPSAQGAILTNPDVTNILTAILFH
ncbi:MAG: hypothetical protein QOG91_453, partial [Candidatus Parcubacteria bacterium]|nr:hypothetical protein [Candidatus Parcubacteria bacterium]